MRCEALTAKGLRCKNETMWGADLCGPHLDRRQDGEPVATTTRRSSAVTVRFDPSIIITK